MSQPNQKIVFSLYDDLPPASSSETTTTEKFADINYNELKKSPPPETTQPDPPRKSSPEKKVTEKPQKSVASPPPPKKQEPTQNVKKKQKLMIPVHMLRKKIESEKSTQPKVVQQPTVLPKQESNVEANIIGLTFQQQQLLADKPIQNEYDPAKPNYYDEYLRLKKKDEPQAKRRRQ